MKTQKILTLDLGTKTGWALKNQNSQTTSGTQNFKPQRFEGGGMRYLRFTKWLEDLNQLANGIDQIYFEEIRRHLGVDAAHAYGGFLAHLTAWCEAENIAYLGIPVGTIKKHVTGKGNANKQAVITVIKAQGFNPKDDNQADALALLSFVLSNQGGSYA